MMLIKTFQSAWLQVTKTQNPTLRLHSYNLLHFQ